MTVINGVVRSSCSCAVALLRVGHLYGVVFYDAVPQKPKEERCFSQISIII